MGTFRKSWWFSQVLLVAYLGVFQIWLWVPRAAIVSSGLVWVTSLGWLWKYAWKTRYFRNRWDALAHLAVILDVLLEATLIPAHGHLGFYWCAAAFVGVIGGYRLTLRNGVAPRLQISDASSMASGAAGSP
jgi:hypothetical protein